MKVRAGILALVFAAVLGQAASAAAQTPAQLKVEKLADGVWAAQPEKGANVGWFLLGDGVVAVDSGADAAIAKDVLKAIADTTGGKPVRALVLTHAHGDHAGGTRSFIAAGARVLCQGNIMGQILALASQSATDPADPLAGKANARPVVEGIYDRTILGDGVHNLQIYSLGPGHTKGDLVVYLPADSILFAGDVASNGRLPFLQSADVDPAGWEKVLVTLSKIPVTKMVPGHGEIGPAAGIADSLAYLRRVNEIAASLVAKGIPDDALDAQIRAPENKIQNVPMNDSHVENVKTAVRILKAKAATKPAPAATPAAH